MTLKLLVRLATMALMTIAFGLWLHEHWSGWVFGLIVSYYPAKFVTEKRTEDKARWAGLALLIAIVTLCSWSAYKLFPEFKQAWGVGMLAGVVASYLPTWFFMEWLTPPEKRHESNVVLIPKIILKSWTFFWMTALIVPTILFGYIGSSNHSENGMFAGGIFGALVGSLSIHQVLITYNSTLRENTKILLWWVGLLAMIIFGLCIINGEVIFNFLRQKLP